MQYSFTKNARIQGFKNPRIQESSQKRQCDFFQLRIQESRNPAKKTVRFFLTQNPRIQAKKTVKFSYTQIPRIQGLWDPRIQESSQKRQCNFFLTQNPRIQESSQKTQCDFFQLRIQESRNPVKKTVQFSFTKNVRIQGL